MALRLTESQRLAIETTDRSIALSAGAGSGKTRVLVLRYLHLLTQSLATVEQILAITFTNKAAGEMKERIQKEVMKHTLTATSVAEKEFWRNVKEDLNQAQISTFHSFCGTVLRQYPLEAGIDPFFRVLEEIEADQLLRDSIEETFLKGLDEGWPDMVTLVREFSIRSIDGLLRKAYQDSRGSVLADMVHVTRAKLEESSRQLVARKAEMQERVEELLQIAETEKLAAGTKTKIAELQAFWSAKHEVIAQIETLTDPARKELSTLADLLKGNVAAIVKEPINRLKVICAEEVSAFLADRRMGELLDSLLRILQEIDHNYRSKKRAMTSMDFEDLQELTIRVLKTNPQLLAHLREQYKFIMVDEFQDTNPVQETLIRLLIGGREDAQVTGNQLFIVGDPKQSIYRFRGADVTIFKELQREIVANNGIAIPMHKNFRSQEKIITFVNHFFSKVFGTSESMYDMAFEPSEFARTCAPADRCVEFMFLSNEEMQNEDLEKREEEAGQLALRIQEMVLGGEGLVFAEQNGSEIRRPVRYGDICILFQALTNIQTYEEALQRYHIPYTVVNGRGFFQRTEIRDLLNLLKLVDNMHREIEWVGVLRSPFVGLSDEELYVLRESVERFSSLLEPAKVPLELDGLAQMRLRQFLAILQDARENRERKELSQLLGELLDRTGYWELTLAHPYAELVRANIQKLVTMTRFYEEKPAASLSGFLQHIQGLEEAEAREGMAQIPGEENMVKLMSVHQSKGLEFPVVILADVQRKLLNPASFPAIFFDPVIGIGMRLQDPLLGGTVQTSLHAAIWEEEKRREIAERKRTLYVAATRARDYLLISGTAKKFKTAEMDEAASWLEWLGLVFNFQTPEQLPEELAYGSDGEHRIRIRQRQTEQYDAERAATSGMEECDLFSSVEWQQCYDSAGIAPIQPRGKSRYYEFGVTQIVTYDTCPRWYYHQYIEHLPTTIATPICSTRIQGPTHLPQSGSAQPGGDVLTTASDALFSDQWLGSGCNSREKTLFQEAGERGTLIHFLCEHYTATKDVSLLVHRGIRQLGFQHLTTPAVTQQLVTEATQYMNAFLQRESELRQTYGARVISDQREVAFSLILGRSLIRGSIDRLIITPDEVLVIDYKSNQVSRTQVAQAVEQYRLQMEMYALAAQRLTGSEKIHCRLHFLLPDEVHDQFFGHTEMIQVWNKVQRLTEEIIQHSRQGAVAPGGMEGFFPCAASVETCPYHSICVYEGLCKDSIHREELGESRANKIR